MTFRESDTLTPGRTITVVDTELGKLGIGICYDLRFQELAMLYAKRGVQLIIFPGTPACLPWTGIQHRSRGWHSRLLLVRS